MRSVTTAILAALIAAVGIFTSACPERRSIGDIERDPGRNQDKEVVIAGKVRDSYGVSIPGTNMGGGAYKIDDGTGSIWVIVTDGSVPTRGTEVGIIGVVGSGINTKGRNYGLGVWEKDRKYKKR